MISMVVVALSLAASSAWAEPATRLRRIGPTGLEQVTRGFYVAGGLWLVGRQEGDVVGLRCTPAGCGEPRPLPCEPSGWGQRADDEHYLACNDQGLWRFDGQRRAFQVLESTVTTVTAIPGGLALCGEQSVWLWRPGDEEARQVSDFNTYCSQLVVGGGETVALGAEEYGFDLVRVNLSNGRATRVVNAPTRGEYGGPPFPAAALHQGDHLWLLSNPNYSSFELYRLDRDNRWGAWNRSLPQGQAAAGRGCFWILAGQTLFRAPLAGRLGRLRLGVEPDWMLAGGGYLWFLVDAELFLATERRLESRTRP